MFSSGVWGTNQTNYVPLAIGNTTYNLSKDGHTHSYLPLSGGTLTGQINLTTTTITTPPANTIALAAKSDGLYQKLRTGVESKLSINGHTHDYLPLSGGVMTGSINREGTSLNLAVARLTGTGTLDIKLPNSNIMGVFYIDLYAYNACVGTLICQFYTFYPSAINFAGANSVAWLGKSSSLFGSVRYVTIGTDNYAERHIYIGNTSTAWGSYLSVNIRSVVKFGESAFQTSPPTISIISTEGSPLNTSYTFSDFSIEAATKATKLSTTRTFALTGDVTGTITSDLTSGFSIATTIAPNSVALGTDTTGNYAGSVGVSGNGLTITGSAGEGTAFIVNSNATNANTASTLVFRDASGNFSAGTITAALSGNATTATDLSRSIIAGDGLSGGGVLNADRTITLGTPSTLSNSSTNSVTTTSHTHQITGFLPHSISRGSENLDAWRTSGVYATGDSTTNRPSGSYPYSAILIAQSYTDK